MSETECCPYCGSPRRMDKDDLKFDCGTVFDPENQDRLGAIDKPWSIGYDCLERQLAHERHAHAISREKLEAAEAVIRDVLEVIAALGPVGPHGQYRIGKRIINRMKAIAQETLHE